MLPYFLGVDANILREGVEDIEYIQFVGTCEHTILIYSISLQSIFYFPPPYKTAIPIFSGASGTHHLGDVTRR